MTTTFGYTPGTGSGNVAFGQLSASRYQNTSGSDVYVDTLTLLNVVGLPGGTPSAQLALYADNGGAPGALLEASSVQTIALGSNIFSLSVPISVAPGLSIWVAAIFSGSTTLSGAGFASSRLWPAPVNWGSALPAQYMASGVLGSILPVTLSGNTTGPGHTTSVRSSLVVAESTDEGTPDLRSALVVAESTDEGTPDLRSSLVVSEPLTEGDDHLRCSLLVFETLHDVPPEGYMSDVVFPTLRGLTYSVHKKPNYSTRISKNPSGREIRNAMYQYPIWDFELVYEWLPDRGAGTTDLKTMMGFFLNRQGAFDTFLYQDPDDYVADAQVIGTGDGVTTVFTLLHSIGDYVEPIGQLNTGVSYDVKVGGVTQVLGTDYTVTMPNTIVFATAPPSGSITWDGNYYFVCRFSDDVHDYEKFMDSLWQLQKCDFQSVPQ